MAVEDSKLAVKTSPWRWWLLGSGVLLLLIVVVIFTTLWAVGRHQESQAAQQAAPVDTSPAAIYVPLNPPFVVNFESRGRLRFLQVSLTVMTRDAEVVAGIEAHMPLVRSKLLMMLGGESYEALQTEEGKDALGLKAQQIIDDILRQEIGKGGVEQLLFTNFVMQ